MNIFKLITALALTVIIYGCADSHQVKRAAGTGHVETEALSVYVAMPRDGHYGKTIYYGSGEIAAQEVAAAISPYLSDTYTANKYEQLEVAMNSAIDGGYTHLVMLKILRWEDRATEWSGRPDQASVKVVIHDVATQKVIDSAVIGGKSGLFTFGGDKPEDLLAEPMAEYAAKFFSN